jgi:cytidylate kinase
MIIAIDGPAGSGKSSVAKEIARRLGFLYVDTGAMYRAVTLRAINLNVDLEDEKALIAIAREVDIDLKMRQGKLKVFLDGEDVSFAIREQELTNKVFYIACVSGVRREMVKLQRSLADKADGAVLEGRDIGTVVYPDADKKFYLDAQFDERVRRRYKELQKMGQRVSLKEVEEDVRRRDYSDRTRDIAPLKKADDAIYIDTTKMSIEEVVEKIIRIIARKKKVH